MSEKPLENLETRIPSKCPNYISFGRKICQTTFAFQFLL